MGTLIRFYEDGICVTNIHIQYYDIVKDTIHWLISHDIGELRLIICNLRLYLRNKYANYMYLFDTNDNINCIIDYKFDIGKQNGRLIVKLTNVHKNKYIIDTPQSLKYKLHI